MSGRDAGYHGTVALRAVLSGGGSLGALAFLRQNLRPEHFTDHEQQNLFIILCRYADKTRGLIGRDALADVMREYPPGTALSYQVLYDTLAASQPQPHEFFFAVDQMRELYARENTGRVFSLGKAILSGPVHVERGGRDVEVQGHEEARAEVMAQLAAIDRDYGLTITPEGDVTVEGDAVLADYARVKELKRSGRAPGILWGIPELDAVLGEGLLPGELALVLSWLSGGKSSFCVQAAWHASVIQGKHVVIFTTEALRDAVRLKLAARHSVHLMEPLGLRKPLDDSDIRAGRLDEDGERALAAVLADWKTGGYAPCNVVQVPDNCTMSMLASRFELINAQRPVDLVVIDYLQVLTPERSGRDSRQHEDQAGIVKAAYRFAPSCNRGRGVPVISPWQVNRDGQQKMKASGGYEADGMAGTIDAGRYASVLLALASPEEDTSGGRKAPTTLTVTKNRSGRHGDQFNLTVDYAASWFKRREILTDESLLDPIGAMS